PGWRTKAGNVRIRGQLCREHAPGWAAGRVGRTTPAGGRPGRMGGRNLWIPQTQEAQAGTGTHPQSRCRFFTTSISHHTAPTGGTQLVDRTTNGPAKRSGANVPRRRLMRRMNKAGRLMHIALGAMACLAIAVTIWAARPPKAPPDPMLP